MQKKKERKTWDTDEYNIALSKIIKTTYLIGYLEDIKRPLVLILPKINGYVRNVKDENNT